MELMEKLEQQASSDVKTVVLPEGTDERVFEAAAILRDKNIANPILLGNQNHITKIADQI